MSTVRPDLVTGVRLAVEDLTARVSDQAGETVGLADERWNDFLWRLVSCGTASDGIQLGRRLIGYRELSLFLVLELANARMTSPVEVMETIGLWGLTLGE